MTDLLNAAVSTAAIVSALKQAIDAIEARAQTSQDAELVRNVIIVQSKVFDVQNALRNGYVFLSYFVENELAERVQRLGFMCLEQTVKTHLDPHQLQEDELDELATHLGEIDTAIVKRHAEEGRRLPAEFDEIVDHFRRLSQF